MSKPIAYKGFTITVSYISGTSRRTCSTVQGWSVSHPRGHNGLSPCGWQRSIADAKRDIDQAEARASHPVETLASPGECREVYLVALADWFPAGNAKAALVRRRELREQADIAKAAQEVEDKRRRKIEAAAPDMLAALVDAEINLAVLVQIASNLPAGGDRSALVDTINGRLVKIRAAIAIGQ